MFRVRVAVVFTVVVIALTVAALFLVTEPVRRRTTEQVEAQVDRAARLCENRLRLDASDLRRTVDTLAHEPEFVNLLTQVPPAERRGKAFVAVEGYSVRIQEALGQKADLLAILDGNGRVLARDLDPAALYGEDLKVRFPAVAEAFKGKPVKDIWNFDGKMYRAGVGPVKALDGTVAGALVVAYVVTARDARASRNDFGTEVAYFLDGRIHASSFAAMGSEDASGKATEDVARVEALKKVLFEDRRLAAPVLETQRPGDMVELELLDDVYRARVGVMPENATNRKNGYVVLASVTDALRPLNAVRNWIIAFGLVVLLAGLGLAVVIARHFLGGLDNVELGVSEVISGNMDYAFEAQAEEFEGMANALNVLLARLLGRPEPGAEEDEAAAQSDILTIEAPSGSPQEVAALSQEPEDAYLRRLFVEYTNARRQLGESVDGLDPAGFAQKIKANEAMLKARLECRAVRFVAQQRGGKVSLRPVPIP